MPRAGFWLLVTALCFTSAVFASYFSMLDQVSGDNASLGNLDIVAEITKLALLPAPVIQQTVDDGQRERFEKYTNKYKYQAPDLEAKPNVTEMCGLAPDFAHFFGLANRQRSRFKEDKIIYEKFFKGRLTDNNQQTFVELGAFDGKTESNTRFYDLCLGWKGLLIEGNPQNYANAVRNRPTAHRMNFAPSCSAEYEATNGTIPFYMHSLPNSGLPGHAKTYEGRKTVDVPCGPLGPVLLDIFGEKGVTFFSLDVEGAEKLVLDTIDFKKVRIEVIMIEVENAHCRRRVECLVRKQVREKMLQEGYIQYKNMVLASDVYVHPESRFQKQR